MSLNRSFLKLSLCEPAFFKGFEFFSEVASLYWTRGEQLGQMIYNGNTSFKLEYSQ